MIDFRTLEVDDVLIDKKLRTVGKVFAEFKDSKFVVWQDVPGFECVNMNSHSWLSEVEYHPQFRKFGVLKYGKA